MGNTNETDQIRLRLEEAQKKKGYSMRRTALESGLSETTVYGILKQGKDPRATTLLKICDTLGVSVSWVLLGDNPNPDSDEILRHLQENPSKRDAILSLLRG